MAEEKLSRRVIWKRKVKLFIKELFHVLHTTIVGVRRASNKHNTVVWLQEFALLKILQRFFKPRKESVLHNTPLLLALEDHFNILTVDNCRLEFLRNAEGRIDNTKQTVFFLILAFQITRRDIYKQSITLMCDSSYSKSLASAMWPFLEKVLCKQVRIE